MSDKAPIYEDFDAYFATFNEEERRELAHADAALDLAILLHRARESRGLTQTAAATRAGVKQQAISRWEHSHPNMQFDTLRRYLEALGYTVDLLVRDVETGEILAPDSLASAASATHSANMATPWKLSSNQPNVEIREADYAESMSLTETDVPTVTPGRLPEYVMTAYAADSTRVFQDWYGSMLSPSVGILDWNTPNLQAGVELGGALARNIIPQHSPLQDNLWEMTPPPERVLSPTRTPYRATSSSLSAQQAQTAAPLGRPQKVA